MDGIKCQVLLSLETLMDYKIAAKQEAELTLGDFLDICVKDAYKGRGVKGIPSKSKTIQAEEGEAGEAECSCGTSIAISATAKSVVCANCNTTYPIKRIEKAENSFKVSGSIDFAKILHKEVVKSVLKGLLKGIEEKE